MTINRYVFVPITKWSALTEFGSHPNGHYIKYSDHLSEINKLKAQRDELVSVLSELSELVDESIEGNYKLDSFTNQPAKKVLAKAKEQSNTDDLKASLERQVNKLKRENEYLKRSRRDNIRKRWEMRRAIMKMDVEHKGIHLGDGLYRIVKVSAYLKHLQGIKK